MHRFYAALEDSEGLIEELEDKPRKKNQNLGKLGGFSL